MQHRNGTQTFDGGEEWVEWWIIKGPVSQDDLLWFKEEYVPYQTDNPGGEYRCRPVIRRTRSGTVVITQRGGWDI